MGNVLVMKFGGTSVATVEARQQAVARVMERHQNGHRLVVVVSAMGRADSPYSTDALLRLACGDGGDLSSRELDAIMACGEDLAAAVLASHLVASGLGAISLRGNQTGIHTDGHFQDARILTIDSRVIEQHLEQGRIVVVPGFQGIGTDGSITTLGRGGSDTTAVALGAALQATVVEIFTDVDGVFSADPRIVPEARLIPVLPYQEAGDLTQHGARVLHPRAAEIAARHGLEVRILNTFSASPGTRICAERLRRGPTLEGPMEALATAITSLSHVSQIRVEGADFAADPKRSAELFEAIARREVSLDLINVMPDRLAFTFPSRQLSDVQEVVAQQGLQSNVGARCAKVTVVGGGIHGVPGVMARIVRTLADAGIAVLQSVDSYTIISVLVAADCEVRAVRLLHAAFDLATSNQAT